MQAVTKQEALAIIAAASTPIEQLYIEGLWYTGSRSGELRTLASDHIGDGYLVLDNLKQQKDSNRIKKCFCPEQYTDDLKALHITGYIFHSWSRPWSKQKCWRIVTEAAEKAGVFRVNRYGVISPVWPHILRHSAGTYMYRQTKDILLVRDQLGHSSVRNTEIYTHQSDDERGVTLHGIY